MIKMNNGVSSIKAHPPRVISEWGIVIFWSYTLGSYPFFIKYFAQGIYQAGYLLLFFVCFLLLIVFPIKHSKTVKLSSSPIVTVTVWFYWAYVFLLILASLIHAGDGYTAANLFRFIAKLITGVVFFYFLSREIHKWMMDRFLDLMLVTSILGILMTLLVFTGMLFPIGELHIPAPGGEVTREFYGLGFGRGHLPFPGGYDIVRLQSFTDEPGTFAFPLLGAIVWAFYRSKITSGVIMIIALLMTWSVGALAAASIVLAGYLFKKRSFIQLILVVIFVGCVAVFFLINSDSLDLMFRYLETKFSSDEGAVTSVGRRVDNMWTLLDAMQHNPEGYGAGGVAELGLMLGIGWMVSLAESGFLGFVFYLLAGAGLVWLAFKSAWFAEGEVAVYGIMILVLAFAAMQRARVDESIWHFWLIAGFIRCYLSSRRSVE